MGATVRTLFVTPVKSTRVREVQRIELGPDGAIGNREFCVIDGSGAMINGKRLGTLQSVVAKLDAATGELSLTFPEGHEVAAPLRYDGSLAIRFSSSECEARVLDGPWSEALSEFTGQRLRLVAPELGVDRGSEGTVSLISRPSVQDLSAVSNAEAVDPRRFRMLIEVDGVAPYEEDGWVGRSVRIGQALVHFNGNVGRCMVTTRDPESGEVNFPTLKLLASYRREMESTEPLPFGIYGEVPSPAPWRSAIRSRSRD